MLSPCMQVNNFPVFKGLLNKVRTEDPFTNNPKKIIEFTKQIYKQ